MTKRAFGELESAILYVLKSGERKTVKEVHHVLGGSYNTVMTVMSRLFEKKELSREKMGLHYEYWIANPTKSASFLDKLKQKFFGVKTTVLVSHLLETAEDLSEDDLAEMEAMLKKIKESKKCT